MNFENFNDYLLSLNISQLAREQNFKKIGMNTLYLLTKVLKEYIKKLSLHCKEYSELANRSEVNIIDVLSVLANEKNFYKQNISNYIRETKFKHNFAKKNYIGKILLNEQQEKNNFIRKINLNNVINTKVVNKDLIDLIPPTLRYFPKDFSLKETEVKLNVTNEDTKKIQSNIKYIEKKAVEEVISSNNYFDNLSKKHKRKNSIDVNNLFTEVHETNASFELGSNLQSVIKESFMNSKLKRLGESNNNNSYEGYGLGVNHNHK